MEHGLGTDIHPVSLFLDNAGAVSGVADSVTATEFDVLKGQFLASLNHELRTPLSGVIGMTDLLAETRLHEEQREYVDSIRECASQLLEALNALLDFSALSGGSAVAQNTEFALRTLLDDVAGEGATRAKAKGLSFHCDWDGTLPESIIGDERYLRQTLHHLLRNAVKFTIRGEISLCADIEAGLGGGRLTIKVRDSGIGIPEDKLRMIFQSFRQLDSGLARSYSGLGLGLALSEKMVRVMGGDIGVESSPGQGTTVSISLPLTIPVHAARLAARPDGAYPRRPVILVVEDNKIAQRVIEHVLERAECDVVMADDGESGLRHAATRTIDLILMDLQMPGMDGFATSKAIRELPGGTHIPILALTANYSDEHRAQCHQLGMQGFLSKPLQREELLNALRANLALAFL